MNSEAAIGDDLAASESFRAAQARMPALWERLRQHPKDFRVLTGERTTGALHVGHYFGSLRNRVLLQDMGVEIFLVMADYQALTDRDADDAIAGSVTDILLDYLGVGMDPERCTIFCHSMVPALNQLLLPFLALFPCRSCSATRPSRKRSRSVAHGR